MKKGTCFTKTLLHVVNESEQGEIRGNNLELIPSDRVQTVSHLSPSLFSQPLRAASFPPGEAKGSVRIRPSLGKNVTACRTPQPLRRQLSSALSGCTPSRTATPAKPFRGAWGLASTNLPRYILNGILRTAADPSGAMRRPPLSGEVIPSFRRRRPGCGRRGCLFRRAF